MAQNAINFAQKAQNFAYFAKNNSFLKYPPNCAEKSRNTGQGQGGSAGLGVLVQSVGLAGFQLDLGFEYYQTKGQS